MLQKIKSLSDFFLSQVRLQISRAALLQGHGPLETPPRHRQHHHHTRNLLQLEHQVRPRPLYDIISCASMCKSNCSTIYECYDRRCDAVAHMMGHCHVCGLRAPLNLKFLLCTRMTGGKTPQKANKQTQTLKPNIQPRTPKIHIQLRYTTLSAIT